MSQSVQSKYYLYAQANDSCIAIVCNGELEKTQGVKEKIERCATCIGVDGGLNHCRDLKIKPHWIVGDFDSVDSQVLEQMQETSRAVKLLRAKDETDLEVAVEKAKQLSDYAQIRIFGGLGGRLDHTLSNLYLVLRNPGRVFLESELQLVFAVHPNLGKVSISEQSAQTLVLLPLYGKAEVIIEQSDGDVTVEIDKKPCLIPFSKSCHLKVLNGEILVCLDHRKLNMSPVSSPVDFSLKTPLAYVFQYLHRLSIGHDPSQLSSKNEMVINIHPSFGKLSFPSQIGETISLIPLYGKATGIETQGLKWELGPATLSQLDKDFVGISNVCMQNAFSVQIAGGQLLCIINRDLIDRELVQATIEKRRLSTTKQEVNMSQPMQSNYYLYAQASGIGALRGLAGLPVEHPFDTIKTRCQANPHVSLSQIIREIYGQNGWKGFYSGAIPNAMRLAIKQTYRWPMMIGFPHYFQKNIPQETQKRHPSLGKVTTGLSIASFETFIINPLERLKVRLMTHRGSAQEKSLTAFFQQHKGQLLPELMKGWNFMYAKQITSWVSFLVTDEKVKKWEKERTGTQQLSFPSLMKVAFVVGGVNTIANFPFDMVKTNLQKQGHIPNQGMVKTLTQMVNQHGIRGLYSGWQMRMLQYMIQSAFTVSVLDRLEQQMVK